MTRMLLTKIPFYKDVILISFDCEHCGYQNNEIQSGGKVEEKGIRIRLRVENIDDLNRTLVKSDFTSIKIPELDFEIPARSQKGGWYCKIDVYNAENSTNVQLYFRGNNSRRCSRSCHQWTKTRSRNSFERTS